MKLRYYAPAPTGQADHRRTLDLLETVNETHGIPVEAVYVAAGEGPPESFPGPVEEDSAEEVYRREFTYNSTLQDAIDARPSDAYKTYGDVEIAGIVGVVVGEDLAWATQFPGTHHGWGPMVDPDDTTVGFLEDVEARGLDAIAGRVPPEVRPDDGWDLDVDAGSTAEPDDGDGGEGDTGGGDDPESGDGSGSGSDGDGRETSDVSAGKPTREEIRDVCTEQSFQRGVDYFEEGRVRDLDLTGTEVTATVRGTDDYRVTLDIAAEGFDTWCTCPYDYDGDCKHAVAALLAVRDRFDDLTAADLATGAPDVEALVAQADPAALRTFLATALDEDPGLRERFRAFLGEPSEKSVADYKREIDRQFGNATSRRGLIEYDTRLDFSRYHDLADAYREGGNHDRALEIYRALAETIRENFGRIDDSGGHHGRELQRAIDAYAECVDELGLDHEAKREYVEYLVEQFLDAEFEFVRDWYDDALSEVCTTTADLEYWRDLVEPHVPDVEPSSGPDPGGSTGGRSSTGAASGPTGDEVGESEASVGSDSEEGRPESRGADGTATFGARELTRGPLDVDDLTGDVLDVEHLAVGPLDPRYFVGSALDSEVRVEGSVTGDEGADGSDVHDLDGPDHSTARRAGAAISGRSRTLLSSYADLLAELGDRETLRALLDEIYLETPEFCRGYGELLVEDGDERRAIAVVEAGLEEFRRLSSLRDLAADLYRDRDPGRYRETLKEQFFQQEDWEAYEELKRTCSGGEWGSTRQEVVSRLGRTDPERLIDLYLHEGDRERALSKVLERGDLDVLKRYRTEVGDLDPEAYFETYRDELEPFLADETGRSHYRTVIGHLEEMAELGLDVEFEAFVDHLREKHSNRPAFLDELETAGL